MKVTVFIFLPESQPARDRKPQSPFSVSLSTDRHNESRSRNIYLWFVSAGKLIDLGFFWIELIPYEMGNRVRSACGNEEKVFEFVAETGFWPYYLSTLRRGIWALIRPNIYGPWIFYSLWTVIVDLDFSIHAKRELMSDYYFTYLKR